MTTTIMLQMVFSLPEEYEAAMDFETHHDMTRWVRDISTPGTIAYRYSDSQYISTGGNEK